MYFNKIVIILCIVSTFIGCRENAVEENLTGTFIGTVFASSDGSPLENAAVTTNPTTTSINTDAEGNFTITDVVIGTYAIIVSKEGFISNSLSVTLEANEEKMIEINLASDDRFNQPPSPAEMISPGMDEQLTNFDFTTLRWSSEDSDAQDELSYTVRLYSEDLLFDELVVENDSDTAYVFENFELGTRYFWQVTVDDGVNPEVRSEVYSFRSPDFPDFPYYASRVRDGELQIITTEVTRTLELTDEGSSYRPRLNNRGNTLAFISTREAEPQIYLSDDNGLDVRRLTNTPIRAAFALDADFCWNPNDTRIFYPSLNTLYAINDNGTGLVAIIRTADNRIISKVDHHPSEPLIAFVESNNRNIDAHVLLFNLDSRTIVDTIFSATQGRVGGLHFSPDGNFLLYTHDVSGSMQSDGRRFDTNIYEFDFNLDLPLNRSINKPTGTIDIDPRYSSTGDRIIFTNRQNDGSGTPSIFQMGRDGESREVLIEDATMVGIRRQ